MSKTLDVYLRNKLVGRLIQDDDGQMLFDYEESWLNDPLAIPLSQSLPLRKERFTRKECRGYFAGILPEASKREIIASNLGISAKNDFTMLKEIGGECAGAVTFLPAGEPLPESKYRYRELNEAELAATLRELPRRPLMAGGADEVRLSLAGVQDKIAVHVEGDKILLPLGGAPSTHILKPAIERFAGTVFNEAVCMELAAKVGLPTAQAEIRNVEGIDYLLVKRYDRKSVPAASHPVEGHVWTSPITQRLHQEDFCQALSFPPENKYQSEGGPSLKECFELLRKVSSFPVVDLNRLLDAVIFNVLIGNNDAHAKNFSLLYRERTLDEGSFGESRLLDSHNMPQLAPLYDLVCTEYYPDLSKKMAMKIGGESISGNLSPKHFEKLAEDAGLTKPMVVKRVSELAKNVMGKLDDIEIDNEVAHHVIALIKERCAKLGKLFGINEKT